MPRFRLLRSVRPLAALLLAAPAGAQTADTTWDVTKPRGKTRTIDFTTGEGTWMNVDLSPDGKWIVFNLLSHIYRVPAAGGQAECLTQSSGIASNFHPRISPDGKTIAFISDRKGQNNIWLMDLDGSNPRAVTQETRGRFLEPTWSPDGRYLVARKIDAVGLFSVSIAMFHRDGGQGTELVKVENNMFPGGPKISPDGRYLYYHAGLGPVNGYFSRADVLQGDYQIRRLDLVTGKTDEIFSGHLQQQDRGSSGGAYAPELSPDGRYLAFARRMPNGLVSYQGKLFGPRTALWARDLRTGAERLLMDPVEVDFTEGLGPVDQALPGYRWTADGKAIVLSQGGKIRRLDVASGQVTTIPFTAQVHRTVSEQAWASFKLSDGPFEVKFPRWYTASPDGRTLAFQAAGRIWLMDLPSGTPRRLTSSSSEEYEYYPAWSPDGRSLAFMTWEEKAGGRIVTAPASGGQPRRVTEEPGEYLEPVWSPDGQRIVAARGAGATARAQGLSRSQYADLVSMPVSGGAWETIARVKGVVPRATFGPDNRVYYFEPGAPGEQFPSGIALGGAGLRVVSVRADGSDRREHLQVVNGGEIAVAPDAKTVAFTIGANVYVAPLSATGYSGALPTIGKAGGALSVTPLSLEGGLYPRWRNAETLTFGSGQRFMSYSLTTKKTDTVAVKLTVPRDIPKGSIALTNARILTMESRRIIPRGTIVARAGRITCVGSCSTSGVDRVVDVGGRAVIPGLVDMHAHHHREYDNIQPPHDFETAIYLAYGVTTTLDPATSSVEAFPTAELIEAGGMIGPRVFSVAENMVSQENPWNNVYNTPEQAYQDAARRVAWGAVSLKEYLQPTRYQRQWVVEAGRRLGVMVTAEGSMDLDHKVSMALDGHSGFEHATAQTPLYGDYTRFLGLTHSVYSETPLVGGPGPWNEEYFWQESELWNDAKAQRWMPWRQLIPHTRRRILRPKTDYSMGMMAQAAADIVAAGGLATIGSHGQEHGLGSHWDTWIYAEAMGPMGALEAATLNGAKFLGMERDLGSVAVGKLADLVVLNADPLQNIRNTVNIRYVLKAGVLYDADSLDELWPRPRKFGDYYWVVPEVYRSDIKPVEVWDKRP